MAERIPQSTTKRVAFMAYLASDHITPATGKTIAITISKNGAAFGNPQGGATNATAIASGWYYVDFGTTDTGTLGPLLLHGTEGTIDPVDVGFEVVNANNAGLAALPNAAAEAAGGLYTRGTGAGQIAQDANGNVRVNLDTIKTQTVTCGAGVTIRADVGTAAQSTAQTGDTYALANGANGFANIKSDTAAIKTKTDYLPSATAGAAGGVFIAGANAATSITTALTANITGNLSGSVGSVTNDVGGKVLGGGGSSITGLGVSASVGNMSAGVLNAAAVNADLKTGSYLNAQVKGQDNIDFGALQKASINAEVLDVLNTDTFAEPGQEAPGATVSLVKKIGYLYKAFRNRMTQDATTMKLYADDATTVDQKSTISDNGTTFDRGEIGTGP